MLDPGSALPAAGQREQMSLDPASIVHGDAPDGANDGVRDHGAGAQVVDEAARGVKTGVRGDRLPPDSTITGLC